jgi:hypothetical protein
MMLPNTDENRRASGRSAAAETRRGGVARPACVGQAEAGVTNHPAPSPERAQGWAPAPFGAREHSGKLLPC